MLDEARFFASLPTAIRQNPHLRNVIRTVNNNPAIYGIAANFAIDALNPVAYDQQCAHILELNGQIAINTRTTSPCTFYPLIGSVPTRHTFWDDMIQVSPSPVVTLPVVAIIQIVRMSGDILGGTDSGQGDPPATCRPHSHGNHN